MTAPHGDHTPGSEERPVDPAKPSGLTVHEVGKQVAAAYQAGLADGKRNALAARRPADEDGLRVLFADALHDAIDGDFLVGAGRTIGNEGGDVAIRDARVSEIVWWAVRACAAALAAEPGAQEAGQ